MSCFFTDRLKNLTPYTPGEQPRDKRYIKLNTNESPFPPSPSVQKAAEKAAGTLCLYSDPTLLKLRETAAEVFGISPERIVMTNGSDEALNFAFMAFADEKRPLCFPDITYGFYPVFAELNHIPYREIPLKDDFTVNPEDYMTKGETVVIANPNAPTGINMSLEAIEKIVTFDPDRVVIIDEAYVDFGGKSVIGLTEKYDNLLVVGTFSKSRSMAGARLGFAIGHPALINDLNTIRYSTNPYNVNLMTDACGIAALEDNAYYMENCAVIIKTRQKTAEMLQAIGFEVLPSSANFLFAKSDRIGGEELYLKLKERGILIRHFTKERIKDYNRITIGRQEDMDTMVNTIQEILREAEV